MTASFRPAVRANVNLLIGIAGASGSGKTFSAMRLASGMSEGKRFAVIDTENGRASHYADQFSFDVAELREPFSPDAYSEIIARADAAGYPVIVIDSFSHEYAGAGGVLDIQEDDFKKMGSRDGAKMLSWVRAKTEHKRMMQKILQVRAHLILCLRAEAKIDIIKRLRQAKIVPKQSLVGLDGWIPLTEKTVPFKLTVSLMLTPDKPGIPHPIKLQQQHRALFPLTEPITEESGRRIAEWARGGSATPGGPITGDRITEKQEADAHAMCVGDDVPIAKLREAAKVEKLADILAGDYDRAVGWVRTYIHKRNDSRSAA